MKFCYRFERTRLLLLLLGLDAKLLKVITRMSIFNKGNGNNVLMPPELAYRVAQTVQKEEETT